MAQSPNTDQDSADDRLMSGDGSAPIRAVDRLRLIYRSEGPFATVYLAAADSPHDAWASVRPDLIEQGATDQAVRAIEARLGLPAPQNTAGHCVIAAADGTTIVDHAAEPPHYDLAFVDTLPYAAPLLEWDQRRVPHVVVTVADDGADITSFDVDHRAETTAHSDDATGPGPAHGLADAVTQACEAISARLVVVAGDEGLTGAVSEALVARLPVTCRVVTESVNDVDDLVDAVVRHVADTVARTTVDHLRDHRFLRTHEAAVDGVADTIAALVAGAAERILIHDDPADQRRLWIGPGPADLSLTQVGDFVQARLNDAIIRSAVLQGTAVYIIPSTGETGPDDDTAAFTS
ncbi:MAG: hypothetical protein OES24_16345 [Acidimicrobiia bacterium]|nr:hypothetical protein [Acidimicrobiia bacterium]